MNLSRFIALRIYRNSEPGKQVSRPAVLIAMVGIALGLAVVIIAGSVLVGLKSGGRGKNVGFGRSGERRVGEEGRSRWAPDHLKKKKRKKKKKNNKKKKKNYTKNNCTIKQII